jgi:hypothetical protein
LTFCLRYELRRFALEAGSAYKQYIVGFGYTLEGNSYEVGGGGIDVVPFYLRIVPRLSIFRERIHVTPAIGFHFYDIYGGGGGVFSGSSWGTVDTLRFVMPIDTPLVKAIPLLETCLGLEFAVSKRMTLLLNASYFTGVTPVAIYPIEYSFNSGPTHMAWLQTRGTYASLTFGLRYSLEWLFRGKRK